MVVSWVLRLSCVDDRFRFGWRGLWFCKRAGLGFGVVASLYFRFTDTCRILQVTGFVLFLFRADLDGVDGTRIGTCRHFDICRFMPVCEEGV